MKGKEGTRNEIVPSSKAKSWLEKRVVLVSILSGNGGCKDFYSWLGLVNFCRYLYCLVDHGYKTIWKIRLKRRSMEIILTSGMAFYRPIWVYRRLENLCEICKNCNVNWVSYYITSGPYKCFENICRERKKKRKTCSMDCFSSFCLGSLRKSNLFALVHGLRYLWINLWLD